MASYNKLQTISGNGKTLAPVLMNNSVRNQDPFDFRETDIMFYKKSQWDNLYSNPTSLSTNRQEKKITIVNQEGWVGNYSLGIRVPRLDGAGNTIKWKPLAILYLIDNIRVKIGSVPIMDGYDSYALFNALMNANDNRMKRELMYLMQPSSFDSNGDQLFEVSPGDYDEISIPILGPGTLMELNRNDDKPRPFPLGKCQNNMVFEINLNAVSEAVETSLDATTGDDVAFTPFSEYDDIRLHYDKYSIQGSDGAVVDGDSTAKGDAIYPYFTLKDANINPQDLALANYKQVPITNIRENGELTTIFLSVIDQDDVDLAKFKNAILTGLEFRLGNDKVYEADSRGEILSKYLLQNRATSYIDTESAGEYIKGQGTSLYNIPFSRQPFEPFQSQFYGVNPDKLQMQLSIRGSEDTAKTYNVKATGLYKTIIQVKGGNTQKLYTPIL